ncbi:MULTISPECIES: DUF4838 domain-containing protein [unclassified Micromonospora]|uniref:DUF4838 domain-containing protein n=1 Tax=unclassified Micromonospora TaxID=2617518 RepID=UPI0033330CF3
MSATPTEPGLRATRRSLLVAGGVGAGAALMGVTDAALAAPVVADDAKIRLAQDGDTRYQVYCGAGEDATVRHAAHELASYLHSITSATFPVVVADQPPASPFLVVVGKNNPMTTRLGGSVDYGRLGEDGFALRTVGQTVFVVAANSRGALYGVYWLLDRLLGVRWFAADYTHIPQARTVELAREDLSGYHVPRFRYRQIYAGDAADPAYRHHNLLNGHRGWDIPPSPSVVAPPVPEHLDTWSTYWPADPFGGNYREMVPDETLWHGGQLLAMDPRTREIATENLVKKLRERIAAGLDPSWGFEQYDADWQPDPASRAFADSHGGALSAAVVDLANDVAARVRQQIPEARLSTQAYWFSFTPPTGIKVGKGVVMTVAPIEANFAHSLFTDDNTQIGDHIKTWCDLAGDIVMWDYVTDFACYIQPFPDYWAFGESIKTLARYAEVGGYFGQSAYNGQGSEFVHLRTWMLGRLLWDPTLDSDALIREFLDGYYGPAADAVYRYMRLMRQSVEDTGTRLTFNATLNSPYLNFDTMVRADELMAAAEAAVQDDPERRKHVQAVRMGVDYVILMRSAEYVRVARERGIDWNPDSANRLARFEVEMRSAGLTRYNEGGGTPETVMRQLRIQAAPASPPATVAGLSASDWVDYQEPALRLWAPVTTIVDDADASNGYTVRMPGNVPDWGVQLPLDWLPPSGTWKLYVSVRADTGSAAPDAAALSTGVWPPFGNERIVKVSELSDGAYHELELPGTYRYQPNTTEVLWIAPPNSPEIPHVYVDRVFAVKA